MVIFGTLMIPVIPLAGQALALGPDLTGIWVGGSIHEIAQVVAAGGIVGGGALAVAVIVKLARVLLLAPVVAVLSMRQRRSTATAHTGRRPAIVPLFIVGFLAMVIIRSALTVPGPALEAGAFAQSALLSAAMFALGCGVKIRNLLHVGIRPFVLATSSTLLVTTIAVGGILLVHPAG